MALILLGASFHFNSSRHLQRNLFICILTRLVLVPGIALSLAALLGFRGLALRHHFRHLRYPPCSVSSFVMAPADGERRRTCWRRLWYLALSFPVSPCAFGFSYSSSLPFFKHKNSPHAALRVDCSLFVIIAPSSAQCPACSQSRHRDHR